MNEHKIDGKLKEMKENEQNVPVNMKTICLVWRYDSMFFFLFK